MPRLSVLPMHDAFEIAVSRSFAVMLANEARDPWERAKLLFNLGIRGGTTRAQVARIALANSAEA